jgi:hypothetical protein
VTWQLLAGLIATLLAGLFASPFIAPIGEKVWRKRQLHYRVNSFTVPLEGAELRLADSRTIRELTVLDITIENTGSVAITPTMFSEPITVRLTDAVQFKVLQTKLFGAPVKDRNAEVADGVVTVQPPLMNKNERVRIWILTSSSPDAVVNIRIADATVVERQRDYRRRDGVPIRPLFFAGLFGALTAVAVLAALVSLPPTRDNLLNSLLAVTAGWYVILGWVIVLIRRERHR